MKLHSPSLVFCWDLDACFTCSPTLFQSFKPPYCVWSACVVVWSLWLYSSFLSWCLYPYMSYDNLRAPMRFASMCILCYLWLHCHLETSRIHAHVSLFMFALPASMQLNYDWPYIDMAFICLILTASSHMCCWYVYTHQVIMFVLWSLRKRYVRCGIDSVSQGCLCVSECSCRVKSHRGARGFATCAIILRSTRVKYVFEFSCVTHNMYDFACPSPPFWNHRYVPQICL